MVVAQALESAFGEQAQRPAGEAVRGGEHRAFDVLAAEAIEQQSERLVGGHVGQIVVDFVAVGGRDVAVGDLGEQRRARRPR